jgi:hypothetical protein
MLNPPFFLQSVGRKLCLLLFLMSAWFFTQGQASPSTCNRLPEAVLLYLKTLDPNVRVREDCLALLSDKRTYLPVLPQGHDKEEEPSRMIEQFPLKSKAPDWIAFDHGFYLLRLLETENGKITFSRTESIPSDLKTGLFPQNFMVPAGFSIPSELRILVGDLPYETPPAQSTALNITPTVLGPIETISKALTPENLVVDPLLLTASVKDSFFTVWDALNWKPKWRLNLGCLSTSATATSAGDFVYVNCLGAAKINIIDLKSQQRLRELELTDVSQQLIHHAYYPILLAMHRYVPKMTFMDSQYHLIKGVLSLPFPLETVVLHPRLPLAYGVDTLGEHILEIDIQQMKILRQLNEEVPRLAKDKKKLPSPRIHQIWLDERKGRFGTLCLMSRESPIVKGVDIFTGQKSFQLKSPLPLKDIFWFENELGIQTPILLTQDTNQTLTLEWEAARPYFSEPTAIEGLDHIPVWMNASTGRHANEVLATDALREELLLFSWENRHLKKEKVLLQGIKSSVLSLADAPSPEQEALMQRKRERFAPNPDEVEILRNLRAQPQRQNGISRLGGALKFAPRDL